MIGPRGSDDTEKVMDVGWGDGALPVITVDFFVRFSLKMKETLWSPFLLRYRDCIASKY